MNIKQVKELVRFYVAANKPCMIRGTFGLGKSQAVRQLTAELFPGSNTYCEFRASLHESIDLRGLPQTDNGATSWLRPSNLPYIGNDNWADAGVLFLDEINAGISQTMQAALYGLVLDRRVGEHVLKPGWRIIAAGNLSTDKAIAQKQSSALASRFKNFTVEPDVPTWVEHASQNNISPELIAFIQFSDSRGESMLHNTAGITTDEPQCPNPRAWFDVDLVIKDAPDVLWLPLIAAAVGENAAAECVGFIQTYRDLPKLADIEKHPTTAKLSDTAAGKFAVSQVLGQKATVTNFDAFCIYLARLTSASDSQEFETMAVTSAVRRDTELAGTPAFVSWSLRNKDIMI